MQHTIQITLDEALVHERDRSELEQGMRQGLILLDYISARISIGRFAELMDLKYEQARDWLHSRGVATLRRFNDPDLEAACETHYQDLATELGLADSGN